MKSLTLFSKYIHTKENSFHSIAQSAGAVEYTHCRGIRPPFNECPGYDTKQSHGEVPVMLKLWGIRKTLFIVIAPRSTLAGRGSTWWGPIYGLNRTNGIHMLNWIVWLNWIELFLTLKLYLHKTELFNIELFWHLTVCKQNLYLD